VGRQHRHRAQVRRGLVPTIAQVVGPLVMLAVIVAIGFYALGGTRGAGNARANPLKPVEPAAAHRNNPGVVEVGETRSRDQSDTTLLQVRKVLAPAGRQAPAGHEWFGIRARTCMHDDARASGQLAWSTWVILDEAGNEYRGAPVPWGDFPPQQLPTTRIAPGACSVGWVLIEVPESTYKKIEKVTFRTGGAAASEWLV